MIELQQIDFLHLEHFLSTFIFSAFVISIVLILFLEFMIESQSSGGLNVGECGNTSQVYQLRQGIAAGAYFGNQPARELIPELAHFDEHEGS
ncbi:MAG: hypothetical protein JKY98_00190 [Gammaproteobacteria bacterium]|nr:hypothetical protein [Gammaproteobacteria bacterium]